MRAEERKLGCWCLGWSRELPWTERWVCMWSGWGLCRRSHLTLLRMPLSLDGTVGKGVGAGGAPSSQAFSHYASSAFPDAASQPLKWEVRIHRYPVPTLYDKRPRDPTMDQLLALPWRRAPQSFTSQKAPGVGIRRGSVAPPPFDRCQFCCAERSMTPRPSPDH